jgi:hypothetical protein
MYNTVDFEKFCVPEEFVENKVLMKAKELGDKFDGRIEVNVKGIDIPDLLLALSEYNKEHSYWYMRILQKSFESDDDVFTFELTNEILNKIENSIHNIQKGVCEAEFYDIEDSLMDAVKNYIKWYAFIDKFELYMLDKTESDKEEKITKTFIYRKDNLYAKTLIKAYEHAKSNVEKHAIIGTILGCRVFDMNYFISHFR